MLLSPVREPVWTSADQELLAGFLFSQSGRKLCDLLAWRLPRYTGDAAKRIVESGVREGYEDCVIELVELAEPPANSRLNLPAPVENFPPLDDDAAWKDFEQQAKEV